MSQARVPLFVLAADPGVTTGWALWSEGMSRPQTGQDQQFEFCSRVERWVWGMDQRIRDPRNMTFEMMVVAERYTIGPETVKKTRQNASLEIIGAMRFICGKYGVPFSLQTPADAKSFATSDKLKRCGWWTPGQQHANDASRHLLLALARRNSLPELLLSSL